MRRSLFFLFLVALFCACNAILGNDSWSPLPADAGGDAAMGDDGPAHDASGDSPINHDAASDSPANADADAAPPPTGTVLGVETFGKGLGAQGSALATNANGDIAIGLTYQGDITVGGKNFTSQGLNDFIVARLDASGNVTWAQSFGTAADENVAAIGIDAAGHVYAGGAFFGSSLTLGSTTLPRNSADWDMYVARLDAADGHVDWATGFAGTGDKQPRELALDTSGQGAVVVAGALNSGTMIFGGMTFTASNIGGFVAKLGTDGTYRWGFGVEDMGGDASVLALAVDLGGDVGIGGGFSSQYLHIGTGTPAPLAKKGQDHDAYVAKVSGTSGVMLWEHNYGNYFYPDVTALAFSSTGDLFTAGFFVTQKLEFGDPDAAATTLSSTGGRDIFLLRLSKDRGDTLFAHGIGGLAADGGAGQDENAMSLAVDSKDSVLLAGTYNSDVLVFDKSLTNNGPPDGFFAKLGSPPPYSAVQSRGVGGPKNDSWNAIAAGAGDTIVGLGTFVGTVDFGTGMPITSVNGAENAFLIRIAP